MRKPTTTTFGRSLLVWMVVLVCTIVGLAGWDAGRELDAALERLARRHRFLAFVVSQDLSSRLLILQQNERLLAPHASTAEVQSRALSRLLDHLQQVQRQGNLTVLLRETNGFGFHTADGRVLSSAALERALSEHRESLVLTRSEASALGMPARRAVAGFSIVEASAEFPALRVVVLSSGGGEADNFRYGRLRTAVPIAFIVVIVAGFSWLLLRQQRRALQLKADLDRAEVERERDAELARAGRFAMLAAMSSGIAHELGGPLTILYGRLEQLEAVAQHDGASAKAHRAMGEQLGRVRAIVRGFMALARGEPAVLAPVSPEVLANEAEELVAHRFARAGVTLRREADADVPPVLCDAPLFVQALVNLLVNACQASKSGDTVVLRVRSSDAGTVFEVDDQGEGIGARVADQAHEPFFTTRAHAGGTGLGLAIANEIAGQNRGTLKVGPRDGGGTRASIELPRVAGCEENDG